MILKHLKLIVQEINAKKVGVYSAQASYYIMISAIPFLMLLLSLLKFSIPVSEEHLRMILKSALPDALEYYFFKVFDMVYAQSSLPVVSVSAVFALWTASASVFALMEGLNNIYGSHFRGSGIFYRSLSMFNTVIILFLYLLCLVLLIFGGHLFEFMTTRIMTDSALLTGLLHLRRMYAILITVILFTFFYTVIPAVKLRFWQQIPGAVFCSAGCQLLSLVFELYLKFVAARSSVYGSLSALIFFLFWLHFCLEIFLIGGMVNYNFTQNVFLKPGRCNGKRENQD